MERARARTAYRPTVLPLAPTGSHLLLVLSHLVSLLVSSLLCPPKVLLKLGHLFLLSCLYLLPEVRDHLKGRQCDAQGHSRATCGDLLPRSHPTPTPEAWKEGEACILVARDGEFCC